MSQDLTSLDAHPHGMTRMRLYLPDLTVEGKGTFSGTPGERHGRFLSETSVNSTYMQGPVSLQIGEEWLKITITNCLFGGFWGIEASFHEDPARA